MNNSFVFYKSFFDSIEMLPTDIERCDYLRAICNLAFYDIEPDLSDSTLSVQLLFTVSSEQVRASIQHKLDGSKGGRPKKDNSETMVKRGVLTPVKSNVNVNVNDNVNVNVNENVNTEDAPTTLTPAQQEYSNKVFELFKDAGLPCGRQNPITFQMTDFNNAIRYLRTTPEYAHIHSNDVLDAVKNYIEVLTSSKTYYSAKLSFFKLVQSPKFYDFLPANYDFNNFLKFGENKEQEQKKTNILYNPNPCPKCNQKKLHSIQDGNDAYYLCDSCNTKLSFEEFMEL